MHIYEFARKVQFKIFYFDKKWGQPPPPLGDYGPGAMLIGKHVVSTLNYIDVLSYLVLFVVYYNF